MKRISTRLNAESEVPTHAFTWYVTKITHVMDKMMACPASILAKSRIIKEKGFVKIPDSSMTGIRGTGHFIHTGTSGQTISFQYSLLPEKLVIRNVRNASTKVMVILPVTLAPPGKIGSNPMRFVTRIKKKTVSK